MRVGQVRVAARRSVRLEQERHGVDAEAGDAELEPEAHHLGDLVPHRRVGHVEVGLVAVEAVEVVLARLLVVASRRSSPGRGRRSPRRRRAAARRAHTYQSRYGDVRAGPGRPEPRVAVRGVVDDQVDDHPHAPVAGGADELDEVAVGAQPRVDAVEVGDVVAVVAVGRGVDRHQPEAGDPELGEVVDALRQPGQVAAAVAVPVEEGLDVEAVDDRGLPPQVAGVGDPHGAVTPSSGSTRVAEDVEERPLLLADVVQVDPVEAEVDELVQPGGVAAQVAGDEAPSRRTSSGVTWRAASSKCSTVSRSQHTGGEKTLVRHWSWAIADAVASSGAHDRWTCRCHRPAAAAVAVGVDHPPQHLGGLVDGDQPVGPAGGPPRRRRRDRGGEQRRRLVRQGPHPGPVDGHQAVVADLLAAVEGADDVHALAQPGVAHLLARPPAAGDVLVRRLARAERGPEAAGEHRRRGSPSPGR